MRKRLVSMLCAVFCLACLGTVRVLATDALQSGCTNGVCGGDLQATAPVVTGNQTSLQSANQSFSPQDGTQPSVSAAQLFLKGEADTTPPQTNTFALWLAIGASIVSLLILAFVVDWFFMQGILFRRFLPKPHAPSYELDDGDDTSELQ